MLPTLLAFFGLGLISTTAGAAADPGDATKLAQIFGARPWVEDVSLSPDGRHVAYVTPGAGQMNVANVLDLATGDTKTVTYADGKPLRITQCNWSANDRLVCRLYGVSRLKDRNYGWSRIVGVNVDGTGALDLGRPNGNNWSIKGWDGDVIDWLSGTNGIVLMARLGAADTIIEQVDTRTGTGTPLKSLPSADSYLSDGRGTIRMVANHQTNASGYTGITKYRYRLAGGTGWLPFGTADKVTGLKPAAIDADQNAVYALQKLDGREALYRVALDGTLRTDLVYADPEVDVAGVETIGRQERIIGYRYITDRLQIVYTDPAYRALAASLGKVLPKLPILVFSGASADERKLILFAASDVDPGHYFLYDRDTHRLTELLLERPPLAERKLADQRMIRIPAADGTMIPAYLALPPGSSGRNLPAIVMPHGGPAARDVWGFDWLVQFFAARGYAVIQPEYRGSTGFGRTYLNGSGFKSWRTAMSDVADAGRWLVKQGIADPDKLAIFGWSYGGYAALQVNYTDPLLFKAVIAVAPVTSVDDLRLEIAGRQTKALVDDFTGSHANAVEASPVRHPDAFRAPVLLFHGDRDLNVGIDASREMDKALRAAGKQSRLVTYPDLDHQLLDSGVRADLLSQSDAFLTKALGLPEVR